MVMALADCAKRYSGISVHMLETKIVRMSNEDFGDEMQAKTEGEAHRAVSPDLESC